MLLCCNGVCHMILVLNHGNIFAFICGLLKIRSEEEGGGLISEINKIVNRELRQRA